VEPGSVLHIGATAAARRQLYRDDHDRGRFLELLDRVVRKYRWSCLSHCLMGNHYHLLIEVDEPNLSEGMQELNGKYARDFNDRTGRDGCVFGARFWARRVSTERYFHAAVRYINLNPVEARFCNKPADWPWSSHRELVGDAQSQRVAVGRTLALLGAPRESDRRPYQDLVQSAPRDPLTYFVVRVRELSPSERSTEVAILTRELGYSNKDVAAAVNRSVRTIERWLAAGSDIRV
jgi:REP element-mobilizing transposase RayT